MTDRPSTRTPEDVLRSVRRSVASALGAPPWRGLLAGDPGRAQRPYFVVNDPDGWTQTPGGVDTDQLAMAMVVYAYPESGERPSETKMIAERVATQLTNWLSFGVQDAWDPTVRGMRQLVPLWGFLDDAGVPLPLTGPESVSTSRVVSDWLRVDDGWSVRARPEAADGDQFVVVANLRVLWLRGAGGGRVRMTDAGPVLVRDPDAPLLVTATVAPVTPPE